MNSRLRASEKEDRSKWHFWRDECVRLRTRVEELEEAIRTHRDNLGIKADFHDHELWKVLEE